MTKKKTFSRVFALALVLCLVVALAVPGFAAQAPTPRAVPTENNYRIRSHVATNASGTNQYLNLYRSYSGNLNGPTNVSVWSMGSVYDQVWRVRSDLSITPTVMGPNGQQFVLAYNGSTTACVTNQSAVNSMNWGRSDSNSIYIVTNSGRYLQARAGNTYATWVAGTNPGDNYWSYIRQ